MNRIVKRHVPVSQLPKDWRRSLPPGAHVSVAITVEPPVSSRTISSLVDSARNIHGDEAAVLSHIGALREDR